MLQDPNYYGSINANHETKTLAKIKQLVSGPSSGDITAKEKDYLTNFETKESQFYGLPKVHKSSEIKNAIQAQRGEYICCLNPEDLSFRPIVGGPNCSTQRLSHLLDILLKPYCEKVPSFIRDDIDFINHLPEHIQPNTKLVSFDVVNLYTNIPVDLGIKAVKYWIDRYPNLLQDRFEQEFILEGLRIILQNNTFAFGIEHFIQTKGTAMGTKVAPTYATLTLGYLEQKLHQRLVTLWGEEDAEAITSKWKRFLDDCFIRWNDNIERLSIFHQLLNDLDSNIKFTMESSDMELPFLDVLVIKEDTKLSTDIFYKSTDTHQYLHFGSCHPHHTKTAIPYNLARRLCAIVSDENTRDIRLKELKLYLLKQGYPQNLIDNGILKAKGYERSELLSTNTQENKTDIIPFVHTHNPRNHNLTSVVHQLNNVLKTDRSTQQIYRDVKFINSRRQPKNLRRILCSSHFKNSYKVTKCEDARCGTCTHIMEGSTYDFNGRQFTVNANMSCATKNVIYVITCAGCQEFYIGETSNQLRARVRVHRQHINSPEYRQIPLSEHLDTCGNKQFTIFPFYKLSSESDIQRREKEKHFIHVFKPRLNN
ncbi:uncharacterized protein LOC134241640 [Saccostrea cucullata]|uniref:uncharacterized protein LOC134241640 n=1 Tax=Saccostrea cuccullata TaxID=36930 RepID=UPI002ED3E701